MTRNNNPAHAHAALLALVATAMLVLAIGGAGVAVASEEVENGSVGVSNSTTSLYAQIEWNSTAGTDNQTADIRIEDENGSVVANRTTDAVDSSTEIEKFDVDTHNISNGDYRVIIDVANGSSGYVNSTETGKFEQVAAGGGGIAESGTAGIVVALVLVLGGGAYYMRD